MKRYYILALQALILHKSFGVNMYRAFILCSLLLINSAASAAIYKWVDHKGVINYGQIQPQRQSITPDKVILKTRKEDDSQKQPESIIDSANKIAESNAKRKAAADKKALAAQEKNRLQKNCAAAKENLANLDYSSNRLHKDSKGNYSRLTPAEKAQQRKEAMVLISENCR